MKRLILVIPITALMSALLIRCRNDSSIDASKFTVEVIDGVGYVHNHVPQHEDTSGIKLERLGKIGKLEGEEEKDISSFGQMGFNIP